jgi:NAD(P)H-quinone oxidoreductase subunit 5
LYTDKFYKLTIVAVIDSISRLINWFDKTFVDGVINLIGIATIFSGQSLKYNVSGQTQFYVLSIVLGLTLIGAFLSYSLLGQAF